MPEPPSATSSITVGHLLDKEHRGGAVPRVGPEPRGLWARAEFVGYANDLKPHLSSTPATPIGAVDGVGDRSEFMSME
jgi:hypothetical protein